MLGAFSVHFAIVRKHKDEFQSQYSFAELSTITEEKRTQYHNNLGNKKWINSSFEIQQIAMDAANEQFLKWAEE